MRLGFLSYCVSTRAEGQYYEDEEDDDDGQEVYAVFMVSPAPLRAVKFSLI